MYVNKSGCLNEMYIIRDIALKLYIGDHKTICCVISSHGFGDRRVFCAGLVTSLTYNYPWALPTFFLVGVFLSASYGHPTLCHGQCDDVVCSG